MKNTEYRHDARLLSKSLVFTSCFIDNRVGILGIAKGTRVHNRLLVVTPIRQGILFHIILGPERKGFAPGAFQVCDTASPKLAHNTQVQPCVESREALAP